MAELSGDLRHDFLGLADEEVGGSGGALSSCVNWLCLLGQHNRCHGLQKMKGKRQMVNREVLKYTENKGLG